MEKNKKTNKSTVIIPLFYWEIQLFHKNVDNYITIANKMLIKYSTKVNKNVDNYKICGKKIKNDKKLKNI